MLQVSPIVLFVYNRPDHTRMTIKALMKNELASESVLYVFADGAKENATREQIAKIQAVREYIHTIKGFKDIVIEESAKNKGLANSVIAGVTKVINQYGRVIVVEDDIVTHPFFLKYMNDCLDTYQDRHDVYMVGGYNYNIRFPKSYKEDVYVVHRACTWGWATWKNRWVNADWEVKDFCEMLNNPDLQNAFNRGGNDLFPMLKLQMIGKIDSWGIRWDYSMYKHDAVCVRPVRSLCINIGFDGTGVHCTKKDDSYTAPLYDEMTNELLLDANVEVVEKIEREFAYYLQSGGKHIPSVLETCIGELKKTIRQYILSKNPK